MTFILRLFTVIIASTITTNAGKAPEMDRRIILPMREMIHVGSVTAIFNSRAPDAALRSAADIMLTSGQIMSIADAPDSEKPPSGNKRDYFSRALYWWPDPRCPETCPWSKIDGKRQPPTYAKIVVTTAALHTQVLSMAAVRFAPKREQYAKRLASILYQFFGNATTRMNPHGQFSQVIGKASFGTPQGLIEFRRMAIFTNGVLLLRKIDQLHYRMDGIMKRWFGDLLTWLETSKLGREQMDAMNNQRTWYVNTRVALALGMGNTQKAAQIYSEFARSGVIQQQIKPNGSQPFEDKRKDASSYRTLNLHGIFTLIDQGIKFKLPSPVRIENIGNKLPLAAARFIAKNPVDNNNVCKHFYDTYHAMRSAIQVYKLNETTDPAIFAFARKARKCAQGNERDANWVAIDDLVFINPL